MRPDDIAAVLRLQRAAYGDAYQESAAVLLDKLAQGPAFCRMACEGEAILGYVLAHPWALDVVPPLHRAMALPAPADAVFVHDLAIAPSAQGRGVGRRLADAVSASAGTRFAHMALVALDEAVAFWQALGFVPRAPGNALAGYGAGARYMVRSLLSD
ncbi:GNAT family N-acetyltransferase [Nitrogeniibacter mangrovi]|nr:GNAT family N-acetyltransferase [Nitrogeniibacter mangrovi]